MMGILTRPVGMIDGAVAELAARDDVVATIERRKVELRASEEPFVWATIDLGNVPDIPDEIQSAWIFALRAGLVGSTLSSKQRATHGRHRRPRPFADRRRDRRDGCVRGR